MNWFVMSPDNMDATAHDESSGTGLAVSIFRQDQRRKFQLNCSLSNGIERDKMAVSQESAAKFCNLRGPSTHQNSDSSG
jgi:hypothetical protein